MKSFFTFAFIATLIIGCQSSGNKFNITADIAGTSEAVTLSVLQGKQPVVIDTAEQQNNQYVFTGKVDLPVLATLTANGKSSKPFFLENSTIKITWSVERPQEITISGSESQNQYLNYLALRDSISKTDHDGTKKLAYQVDFVKNNPTSVPALYVLFRELSYQLSVEELDTYLHLFDTTLLFSPYAQLLSEKIDAMKRVAVGQPYIDFSLPDTTGNMIALSSVIGKSKYVFLDFWASWCPPCRAEKPNVVKAYNTYKSKGFEIFSVSLDKTAEAWKTAIKTGHLSWFHVSSLKHWDSEPAKLYGVGSIPSNFLLDSNGVIVAHNLYGQELHDKLAELLK